MPELKTLLALAFHHLIWVRAVSIPSSLQLSSANTTVPSVLSPNAQHNLSEPPAPPGFEARLTFLASVPLRPIESYINAIEMMAFLSQLGWNNHVPHSTSVRGDHFKDELCVFPTLPGDFKESGLPVKYAITGLYTAGVIVSGTQQFSQLFVSLYVKDSAQSERKVGYFAFRPKNPQNIPSQSQLTIDTNMTGIANTSSNSPVAAGQKGRVTDKTDPRFYITYDWNGNRLKSQDLFTAFLNALSIASVHDNEETRAFVPNAPSASQDITVSTWTSGGASADLLTWGRVKRGLQLVWGDIIMGKPRPRFEDLDFELWYMAEGRGLDFGEKIGGGRVWKFDAYVAAAGYNGTDAVATS